MANHVVPQMTAVTPIARRSRTPLRPRGRTSAGPLSAAITLREETSPPRFLFYRDGRHFAGAGLVRDVGPLMIRPSAATSTSPPFASSASYSYSGAGSG